MILICLASKSSGQSKIDSTYIRAYPNSIFTRLFYFQNVTGFHINDDEIGSLLKYTPNTNKNLGLGISYKWATLNLAYGFGFLNQDQENGRTRYIDIQAHNYLGKWNIDLYAQSFRGYYLEDESTDHVGKYLRPDIRLLEVGASVQHVFNHEEFSFKAAFLNIESQEKSAGTFLLGMDVFYGKVDSDSTFTPYFLQQDNDPDHNKMEFVKFGPLGGYAHTLVFKKRFFATGVVIVHVNSGIYHLRSKENKNDIGFLSTDLGLRGVVGYSSGQITISAMYMRRSIQFSDNYRNIITTGNFRTMLTYRFQKRRKR